MAKYEANVQATQTASGLDYTLLETPGTQKYRFQDLKKFDIPGDPYDTYRGIVKCNEIIEKKFPNAANPREPDSKGVVVDMQTTLSLADERTLFHRYNNGMTLVCSDISDGDAGEHEIDFEYKDGICNGGHTYFSVVTHPDELHDNSFINIEIIVIPHDTENRQDEITRIADRRNKHQQLSASSKADARGWYNRWRSELARWKLMNGQKTITADNTSIPAWEDDFMEVSEVQWHEGDSKANHDYLLTPSTIIRWLKTVDPQAFGHRWYRGLGWSPVTKASDPVISPGKMHDRWFDLMESEPTGKTKDYSWHMMPLLPDVLLLSNYARNYVAPNEGTLPAGVRGGKMVTDWWQGGQNQDEAETIGPMAFEYEQEKKVAKGGGFSSGAMFTTMPPVLLNVYRSVVWMGTPDTMVGAEPSKLQPRYIGWLVDPKTLDSELGEFVEKLHNEFSTIADNPATEIKKRSICYTESLFQQAFGNNQDCYYPWKFYDRCDVLSHYIQCAEEEATHIMLKNDGDHRFVEIVEFRNDEHDDDKKCVEEEEMSTDNHNLYKKYEFDITKPENLELLNIGDEGDLSEDLKKIILHGQEEEALFIQE